ncbi:MAG: TatD family hydrolase [Williamsia sp.]|nr:TatD family hydrolase [Williamsia sp.]
MLIDTHCHLYLPEFKNDLPGVMDRAQEAGVEEFYLPAIDSTVVADMMALEAAYPSNCFCMMGLHPCSVKENYEEELALVESWLTRRPFAAIGETGLDFYWDRSFEQQQYDSFHRQLEWGIRYNLPVVIHSRDSTDQCIQSVRQYQNGSLRGIFHCFTGTHEQARQITAAGFYLGIGGVLTYKNAGLAASIKDIPLEYLVLETDAPYLSPVPLRGKRNESSYLTHILAKLAEVKGLSREEVEAATTANAEKIFGT